MEGIRIVLFCLPLQFLQYNFERDGSHLVAQAVQCKQPLQHGEIVMICISIANVRFCDQDSHSQSGTVDTGVHWGSGSPQSQVIEMD